MVVIMPVWWIVARKILKIYRSKGYNFRKVIIVGYGRTGKLLEKELQSDAGYGYKIMDKNLINLSEHGMTYVILSSIQKDNFVTLLYIP